MSFSRLSICLLTCVLLLPPTAASAQRADFGTLAIQVRPPDAEIFIDGERWAGSETTGTLSIQLSPGVHRVELRSRGGEPYSTEITIRAGETTPLNVALTGAPAPRREPPLRREAPPASAPPSSGDATLTSVAEDGFVIAPDVRISEIGHDTVTLVGAYGGYVFAAHLLVGLGGYWQADSTNGLRLAYGGPVAAWRLFPERTVGVNLHGLIGAGQLYADHDYYYFYGVPSGPRNSNRVASTYLYGYGDVFFVAEPEAQVVVRLGSSVRLLGGIGYRMTSAHGLDGTSGSISVQFGR